MLNKLWAGILLLSIVFGAATGRIEAVGAALLTGGGEALTLLLTLGGAMCLWGGLMRIADRAGFTRAISRLTAPLMRLLFPSLPPDGEACRAMSMNIAANVLGLGNAATPLGLEAMKRLRQLSPDGEYASRDMVVFVVLNTASVQLIPTTVAALRMEAGSASPLGILPAVWMTSVGAAVAAVTVARLGGVGQRVGKLSARRVRT